MPKAENLMTEDESVEVKNDRFSKLTEKQKTLVRLFFGFIAVAGQVCQNIALPLWVDAGTVQKPNCTPSEVNSTDPGDDCTERSIDSYFVYTFACLSFVIIFGIMLIFIKLISPKSVTMADLKYPQKNLFLIGMFDALNGVMVVMASNPNRTAPYLQSILGNFIIPWTVFFRFVILRKTPTILKAMCSLIVFLSLILCILPDVIPGLGGDTKGAAEGVSAVLWPIIFMLGFTPAAIMNVIEEKVLQDTSKVTINLIYFFFCTSTYQLLTAMALFWADILPWYGNAANLQELGDSWSFGFKCFFGGEHCSPDTGVRGSTFIIAYTVSYIGGGLLLRYTEGAVLVAVATSIVTPLGFVFWSLFQPQPFGFHPEANDKTWFAIAALVVMIPAIFFYNYNSRAQQQQEDEEHLSHDFNGINNV